MIVIANMLTSLSKQIADLTFPPRCFGCNRSGYDLCPTCAQKVEPINENICHQCGRLQTTPIPLCSRCQQGETAHISLARAATLFHNPLRDGIHSLKYDNKPELAVPLARFLYAVFQQPPWSTLSRQIDTIIPVPMHQERFAERGYNQAERLATAFGALVKLPVDSTLLERLRATPTQVGLDAVQRRRNVAGAFRASRKVSGAGLLLVDDVFTTGATLVECASALHNAGARNIYALTLTTPALGEEHMA